MGKNSIWKAYNDILIVCCGWLLGSTFFCNKGYLVKKTVISNPKWNLETIVCITIGLRKGSERGHPSYLWILGRDLQMDVMRPLAIISCMRMTPNRHYYGRKIIYHMVFSNIISTKFIATVAVDSTTNCYYRSQLHISNQHLVDCSWENQMQS